MKWWVRHKADDGEKTSRPDVIAGGSRDRTQAAAAAKVDTNYGVGTSGHLFTCPRHLQSCDEKMPEDIKATWKQYVGDERNMATAQKGPSVPSTQQSHAGGTRRMQPREAGRAPNTNQLLRSGRAINSSAVRPQEVNPRSMLWYDGGADIVEASISQDCHKAPSVGCAAPLAKSRQGQCKHPEQQKIRVMEANPAASILEDSANDKVTSTIKHGSSTNSLRANDGAKRGVDAGTMTAATPDWTSSDDPDLRYALWLSTL